MSFDRAKTKANQLVFAVGDIHGCDQLLNDAISLIKAKMEQLSETEDNLYHIVFLGDYIDRGPNSRLVIERLMSLNIDKCEIHCLKGNHEDILLNFIKSPQKYFQLFKQIGGIATLNSFGIMDVEAHRAEQISAKLVEAMGIEMLVFLTQLPTYYSHEDYFFCHGVPKAGIALSQQPDKILINNRHEASPFYEQIVIHGHVSSDKVERDGSKINIDTAAYVTDNLTKLLVYNYNQIIL
ncbi:MAG: metallophosphoesterase [Rhizobiales bacterium]|nr:metallophosphoesterase [Hyphomicrobiales bacterium]NRB13168.1 metallophosphoesterase [Hyphomicrobiales bacterium]